MKRFLKTTYTHTELWQEFQASGPQTVHCVVALDSFLAALAGFDLPEGILSNLTSLL